MCREDGSGALESPLLPLHAAKAALALQVSLLNPAHVVVGHTLQIWCTRRRLSTSVQASKLSP